MRRRVKTVEEVVDGERFETLFAIRDDRLAPTGRIDRGNSSLVASLARSDESYADVREALARREALLEELAHERATDPVAVVSAYADRRDP